MCLRKYKWIKKFQNDVTISAMHVFGACASSKKTKINIQVSDIQDHTWMHELGKNVRDYLSPGKK